VTPKQLAKLLESCDLSQRGAARALGISERQIRRYCAGDAPVPQVVELALLHLHNVHEGLVFKDVMSQVCKNNLKS